MPRKKTQPTPTLRGSLRTVAVSKPEEADKARQDLFNTIKKAQRIAVVLDKHLQSSVRPIEKRNLGQLLYQASQDLVRIEDNIDIRFSRILRRLEVKAKPPAPSREAVSADSTPAGTKSTPIIVKRYTPSKVHHTVRNYKMGEPSSAQLLQSMLHLMDQQTKLMEAMKQSRDLAEIKLEGVKLPVYGGTMNESFQLYKEQVEQYFFARGIDWKSETLTQRILAVLGGTLRQGAAQWFIVMKSEIKKIDEFFEKLEEEFVPADL
ncbi:hypothetical protein FI667_g13046, partial [Globisporangium splendens]